MILCPIPGRMFRITQRLGGNTKDYARFGLDGHNGIDFAPFIRGMPPPVIHAPHDGYVTLGDEGNDGYGRFVSIVSRPYNREGMQRRSDLAHLREFYVRSGQFVAQGDPVGLMGNTGFSTGTHLHWTFKRIVDGITLDYGNGYKGAIDVGKYTVYWSESTLG